MPTRKAPQPAVKIEDMTDLEASFEAAIAEAERDGYVSAEETRRHMSELRAKFKRMAVEGKIKP
jgi:predicted alpha/beta hydrolase family esterase